MDIIILSALISGTRKCCTKCRYHIVDLPEPLCPASTMAMASLRTCSRSFLISADYADAPKNLSERHEP
ncbi:hypothetical protein, partial [Xanthomonas campestris]|uniref:hypothetical protein n=1 Tax=Xanthomonas campestris TaxID=339 RepID=UPI002B23CB66